MVLKILTEPKNAIVKQYQQLFNDENVELSFTEDALRAIAVKAKSTGTGARALRMIVENLLLDLMYTVPSESSIKEVIIEEACVTNGSDPIIKKG